jgi:hypothetical protein
MTTTLEVETKKKKNYIDGADLIANKASNKSFKRTVKILRLEVMLRKKKEN